MRIRIIAAAMLAAAAVFVAVPSARAEVYLGKGQAQSDARYEAKFRYGKGSYSASCRPQGLEAPRPGYVYNRWICDWYDSDYGCSGTLRIRGKRGPGWYYALAIHGMRCGE